MFQDSGYKLQVAAYVLITDHRLLYTVIYDCSLRQIPVNQCINFSNTL